MRRLCPIKSVRVFALALLMVTLARPATAIDLSGTYVSFLQLLQLPCSLTFSQSGTTLPIDGPCTLATTSYTFQLTGTVDIGDPVVRPAAQLPACGTLR